MKKQQKVALIQGGQGAESKISLLSGQAVSKALDKLGISYKVFCADAGLPVELCRHRPDILFLAVHGQYGEDGCLQALAEYLKIPYTGSGLLSSSLCMDKCFFKDYICLHKIPTPAYFKIQGRMPGSLPPLDFPLVVKPARQGSSLGIGIVRHHKEWKAAVRQALQYDQKILVESYVEGTEIAVSFLDGQVLMPVEIKPKKGFYNYNNKYTKGATEYLLPPGTVSQRALAQCRKWTKKAVDLLNIRSYCRVDFIVHPQKGPFMIEVNTLPGLTAHSLLPKSAQYEGIGFSEVVDKILNQAALDYR